MDFELTRTENDERLLAQIEAIRTAKNIDVLIPFAKAYLGMFYVIDAEIEDKEKIKLLANGELAAAVIEGFIASLKSTEIESVEAIGHANAEKKEFHQGYVILAGLDLVAKDSLKNIAEINLSVLESAVGFYLTNKTNHQNIWFDYLSEQHKDIFLGALFKYWQALLKNGGSYLPYRYLIFSEEPDINVIEFTILMLLKNWQHCKAKVLFQLLSIAFQYSDKNKLLDLCEEKLEQDESLTEKTRLYWLATAFLLSPDKHSARLSSYVSRVKLKIMPLLDFVISVSNTQSKEQSALSDKLITQLLRMIAPVFPPQQHVYGTLGGLDINSRNVMKLFYLLVLSDNEDVTDAIKWLRKARVMKIYAGVIDDLLEIQIRKKNEQNYSVPDFDSYIDNLAKNNNLDGRTTKFDLR